MKKTIKLAFIFLCLTSLDVLAVPGNNIIGVNKPGARASFSFDTKSVEPLIEYSLVVDMIEGGDTQSMLKIFGDGRVLVHYPKYMKNAGDYEMQISQQELIALLESFSADGLMEFDSVKVNQRKHNIDKAKRKNGELHYISDNVMTQININLKGYQSLGIQKNNFKKQIRLKNIEKNTSHYSSILELKQMNNSVGKLRAYLKRKELKVK